MCIAIYKPAGQWVSKEELRVSFDNNPDGAGFAYHNGTRVVIEKGFFSFRAFWRAYKRAITNDTPAFAHFRIATRGAKNAANCHPFAIPGGVLMHNGPCLNRAACAGTDVRSDSKQFAEDFIAGLTALQVLRIKPMIEQFIGSEKVALLFDSGDVVICNENQGLWEHGCWFSNTGHHKIKWSYPLYNHFNYGGWQRPTPISNAHAEPISTPPRYIYNRALGLYIPKTVVIEGAQYEWSAEFSSYLKPGTSDSAMADDDFVYDFDRDGNACDIVGEVIHDENQLRLFLELELDDPINLPRSSNRSATSFLELNS